MRYLSVATIIYSIFIWAFVGPILNIAKIFSDRVKRQLQGRADASSTKFLIELATLRMKAKNCAVFFCSSAGEFEQAKPIIDRLQKANVFTHVFFFSRSGVEFAEARQEESSYSLSPLDIMWTWGAIFSVLRPKTVILVRHEFWPAFLMAARQWATIALINGVPPSMLGREPKIKTKASAFLKKLLLGPQAKIYTVDQEGQDFYANTLGYKSSHLKIVGDSKYDRVFERVEHLRETSLETNTQLKKFWMGSKPILILGSAHLPDLNFILETLRHPKAPKVKLLVVPHDLSSRNIIDMTRLLKENNLISELYSEVEVLLLDKKQIESDAIVVDTLGRLSELYGVADLAWIGGAIHSKIHNVLEPAAWGVPMSSGTRYQNSQEAKILKEEGLLFCTNSRDQLIDKWHEQLQVASETGHSLTRVIKKFCGTSESIIRDLNIIEDQDARKTNHH
ncbi:MAG: hypothetical protein NT027_07320 [Proteobacteria bacterium]|nr:hypothetical protein [Pseudomonadota bacterium]